MQLLSDKCRDCSGRLKVIRKQQPLEFHLHVWLEDLFARPFGARTLIRFYRPTGGDKFILFSFCPSVVSCISLDYIIVKCGLVALDLSLICIWNVTGPQALLRMVCGLIIWPLEKTARSRGHYNINVTHKLSWPLF